MRPPALLILLLCLLLGTGCAELDLEWPGRDRPRTDPPADPSAAEGVVVLLEVELVPYLGEDPEERRLITARRQLGKELDPAMPILRERDRLDVRIVARNTGPDPVTLRFNSGKKFDLLLLDSKGATCWSAGQGRGYTAALQEVTLDPGEEMSQQEVVSVPLPGNVSDDERYTLVGILEGRAKARSQPQKVLFRLTR